MLTTTIKRFEIDYDNDALEIFDLAVGLPFLFCFLYLSTCFIFKCFPDTDSWCNRVDFRCKWLKDLF